MRRKLCPINQNSVMNTTFKLFAGLVVASVCPTTASEAPLGGCNNIQTVFPIKSSQSTYFAISPVDMCTAVFPNSFMQVQPPKKRYADAFKKMSFSKTMRSIYVNASIGDAISID